MKIGTDLWKSNIALLGSVEFTTLKAACKMPATKNTGFVKIAIEKEGQLPLLTTFDQVRIEVSPFGMSVLVRAANALVGFSVLDILCSDFLKESTVG